MEITSKTNSIIIDGREVPKSSVSYDRVDDGIQFRSGLSGKNGYYAFSDIVADGQNFENKEDLYDWLSANSFKSGGTGQGENGVQSVSGDLVTGTSTNPVVNLPTDVIRQSDTSMMPSAGKVPIFSPQGLLSTGTPQFPENAVPLSYLDVELSNRSQVGHSHSISDVNNLLSELNSRQSTSEKDQAGGYPSLDSSGKIPLEFLNVSGLQFKGAWNANTNTPSLLNGTGSVGDFYKVSEGGTYNFGNGNFVFSEGDWVMFAAGVWQRIGVHEAVVSVNGKIGAVVITKVDVGLGNVDNVSAAQLRDRSTHTGEQSISTITDLQTELDKKLNAPTLNERIVGRDINGNIASFPYAVPANPSSFAFRDSAGRVAVGTPINADHAVTKSYADALKAPLFDFTTTSAVQTITVTIAANAPSVLRFEVYIPNTLVEAWVGLRVNGHTDNIYKSLIQHVNSASYSTSKFYGESQLRLFSKAGGVNVNKEFVRIEGTISNIAGALKIVQCTGYGSGALPATEPDVNIVFGACHKFEISQAKITQLQFRTNPTTAGFTTGSRVVIYGM